MGLFSRIGKAIKKVVKGVVKVFKKAVKFVGKIMSSKWGKILMIAAAVFTGGMAIAAGVQGFSASAAPTFLGKFVAGAKEFVTALAHPVANAKKAFGAAQSVGTGLNAPVGLELGGEAAANAPMAAVGATTDAATLGTTGVNLGGGALVPESQLGMMGGTQTAAQGAFGAAGKVAGKVGGGLLDLAKSQGGGMILAQGIQGFAQGKQQEVANAREAYMTGAMSESEFNDIVTRAGDMQTPQGFLDRARQTNRSLTRPNYPVEAGDPNDVYGGYVRGMGG